MVRTVVAVLAAAVLAWLIFRYVVLALLRRRRVIFTPGVAIALVLSLAVVIGAVIEERPAAAGLVIAGGVVAITTYLQRWWVIFGASVDFILQRAELVARGLRMQPTRSERTVSVNGDGGFVVSVVVAVGSACVLSMKPGRDKDRSLLFSKGLYKFVGPKP